MLTWWQGRLIGGEGRGEGVIYDTSYRPVRRVRAGNGLQRRPARVRAHAARHRAAADLRRRAARPARRRRRAHGIVVQAVVQEIDIATGLVRLRVAQPRQHRRCRSPTSPCAATAGAVGLRARELGRARRRRRLHRLRPPDLRGLPDLAPHRARSLWRLGGKRSDFRIGRGHALRPPARRAPAARRHADDLRQQRAAAAAQGLARDHGRARHATQDGDAGPPSPTRDGLLSATQGGVAERCPTATRSSAGARGAGSPSTTRAGTGRASTGASRPATTTTAPTAFPWTGRPARAPALRVANGSATGSPRA